MSMFGLLARFLFDISERNVVLYLLQFSLKPVVDTEMAT